MINLEQQQRIQREISDIDQQLSLLRQASLKSASNPIERNIHNKNILKLQELKLNLALKSYS